MSATTTFSLRPAVKTTTSAISSGVKGSQPLQNNQLFDDDQHHALNPRIDCIRLGLVSVEADKRELLVAHQQNECDAFDFKASRFRLDRDQSL